MTRPKPQRKGYVGDQYEPVAPGGNLSQGEVLALLREGELVITPEQQQALNHKLLRNVFDTVLGTFDPSPLGGLADMLRTGGDVYDTTITVPVTIYGAADEINVRQIVGDAAKEALNQFGQSFGMRGVGKVRMV